MCCTGLRGPLAPPCYQSGIMARQHHDIRLANPGILHVKDSGRSTNPGGEVEWNCGRRHRLDQERDEGRSYFQAEA